MNKPLFSRALMAAAVIGVAGVAGVAQAETFNSPTQAGEASTMTHGAPNQLTTNTPGSSYYSYDMTGPLPAPVIDTTVLGGPPVVVYESSTIYPSSVYVHPSTDWSYGSWGLAHGGATASSRVPDRAGEASTIVNGVPNRLP